MGISEPRKLGPVGGQPVLTIRGFQKTSGSGSKTITTQNTSMCRDSVPVKTKVKGDERVKQTERSKSESKKFKRVE